MRGKKLTCVITAVALVAAMVSSAVFANNQTTVERNSETESSLNSAWLDTHLSDKYDTERDFFAEAREDLKLKSDTAVKSQIVQDVDNLEACAIMKDDIAAISVKDGSLQYTLDYGKDISLAYVDIVKNSEGDTILHIKQDGIKNEMIYKADGRLFVDGNEILFEIVESDNSDATLSPNMRTSVFSPKSFQSIPIAKYDKLIKDYGNLNINLGKPLTGFAVTTLAGMIISAIKKIWKLSPAGMGTDLVMAVAGLIISGYDPAYGSEDAYISFKIQKIKCTSKSSGYEQFFRHKGIYYSRANCKGTEYPHSFYEYEFLN